MPKGKKTKRSAGFPACATAVWRARALAAANALDNIADRTHDGDVCHDAREAARLARGEVLKLISFKNHGTEKAFWCSDGTFEVCS